MQDGSPVKPLSGKVAIVTGAGRGLGEAICQRFAAAGATVVPTDLRFDLVEKVAMEAQVAGAQSMPLRLDVADEDEAEQAVQVTVAKFGRLDILVNTAEVDASLSIEDLTISEWDHILGVNLRGAFLMSRFAFPAMREHHGGSIVNVVSSDEAHGWANASAYQASKWGLLAFSRALHVEGRAHRVKVTSLLTGGLRTPLLLEAGAGVELSKLQDPRNVAQAVLFVVTLPDETVIPELTVLPMGEFSWP
jgi:NAD(P)-dependent dehydrogenase (short-subunit alcohol dehydrogenase family)